ncbi:hypothetical protein NVP1063O_117 [Vibrio phage 1.063.O._10N.261.45.C7]|nr:hypothetical protein NVP1063O_117 [Vibrio phage 1.063.O._10N.261.45.C7]
MTTKKLADYTLEDKLAICVTVYEHSTLEEYLAYLYDSVCDLEGITDFSLGKIWIKDFESVGLGYEHLTLLLKHEQDNNLL